MMFHRLALQRRRLFVATLLSYLGGLIYLAALQASTGFAAVLTGAAGLALATLVAGCLVVLALPAARKLCETVAGGGLLAAVLARNDIVAADNAGRMLAALVLCAVVVHLVFWGPHRAQTPPRVNWTTRRRFHAPVPAAAAWARLVPDPARPEAHYSGLFLGQRGVDGHPDQVIQTTRSANGATVETRLTIHAISPPHHIRYSYDGSPAGANFASGDFSLTIWPNGQTCKVAFCEPVHALPFGTALDLWFDDFGGEMRASMQAALRDRPDLGLWARGRARNPARVA